MRRLTTLPVADAKAATLPAPATAHGSRPVDVRIVIEFGITSATADGASSDVEAGVGDHPAVFGWGMSDQGCGSSPGTPDERGGDHPFAPTGGPRPGTPPTPIAASPPTTCATCRSSTPSSTRWPTRPRAHPSSMNSARDEVTGAVSIR